MRFGRAASPTARPGISRRRFAALVGIGWAAVALAIKPAQPTVWIGHF